MDSGSPPGMAVGYKLAARFVSFVANKVCGVIMTIVLAGLCLVPPHVASYRLVSYFLSLATNSTHS